MIEKGMSSRPVTAIQTWVHVYLHIREHACVNAYPPHTRTKIFRDGA